MKSPPLSCPSPRGEKERRNCPRRRFQDPLSHGERAGVSGVKKETAFIEKTYIADAAKLYREAESEYKARCGELRPDHIEIRQEHPNNYIR